MAAVGWLNSRLVFWANLIVGVGLLAVVLYAYGGQAIAVLRLDRSLGDLAGFGVAVAASIVCLSWRWGFVLAGVHRAPSLWALVLYRSAAHSLAVLIPSGKLGGDPLRAFLAVRSGVPPAPSIASIAADRTLEVGASAPFSIIFATLLLQHGVPQIERALVTVTVATVALVVGVAIAVRRLQRGAGLVSALVRRIGADRWSVVDSRLDVITRSEEAAAELAGQRRRMWIGFAAGLLANGLVIAEFALLLRAFGLPADGIAVVAAIFATGAAHMLPVPGGLGVLEGAQMWLFQMLGYPPDVGLAVGLVVRLRELLWMAPGLAYLLARTLRSSIERTRPA